MSGSDLKDRLKKIRIDGRELYLDGDLVLDAAQLDAYASGVPDEGAGPQELLAMTDGRQVVRWKPGLVLTYAVVRGSFPDDPKYGDVVVKIEDAAKAWQDACGVRFEHVDSLDRSPEDPAARVVFTVRYQDAGGAFLAAGFFPNEKSAPRRVLIDPAFFGAHGVDLTGILRHELGHVLGFRHEHIRDAAAAAMLGIESLDDTFDLTEYDAKSVMHYVSGSYGNPRLEITDLDRLGAQRIYGLPINQLLFAE